MLGRGIVPRAATTLTDFTMLNRLTALLGFTVTLALAAPSFDWDPMPSRPAYFTGDVRVLDTELLEGFQYLIVPVPDAPADLCAQNGALNRAVRAGGLPRSYDSSWIASAAGAPGMPLTFFMAAKAQNLPDRVLFRATRNEPCVVGQVRTCADATASAVPRLRAN